MKSKPSRKRLDLLLVERGLAESTSKAQAMILAGEVSVDDVRADKAGSPILEDARVAVTSRTQKYASRAGLKLEGALVDFAIDPADNFVLGRTAIEGPPQKADPTKARRLSTCRPCRLRRELRLRPLSCRRP